MILHFTGIDSAAVQAYRNGGDDAHGQKPLVRTSDGQGNPCRHCLEMIGSEEDMLVLAHMPFPIPAPYSEVGPIFLHAVDCLYGETSGALPPMLGSPTYLIRGYGADDEIFYGTGQVIDREMLLLQASAILARDEIAYVHVRSASNNCFQCRVERQAAA